MAGALRRAAGRGAGGRGAGGEDRRRTAGAGRAGAGGRGAAGAGRGGGRRAVPGGRGRVPGAGQDEAEQRPARMTPRLSCSVPAPTVTRRPGSPPDNNLKAQHAAAGTPGKAERRRGLHSGAPDPVELEVRQVWHADPSRGSLPRIYAAIPRYGWMTGAHILVGVTQGCPAHARSPRCDRRLDLTPLTTDTAADSGR